MLTFERRTGTAIQHAGLTLTPQQFVAQIRFPGGKGAITFNRAIAILVQRDHQPTETIPILNLTRIAIAAIWAVALFAAMLISWRKS